MRKLEVIKTDLKKWNVEVFRNLEVRCGEMEKRVREFFLQIFMILEKAQKLLLSHGDI